MFASALRRAPLLPALLSAILAFSALGFCAGSAAPPPDGKLLLEQGRYTELSALARQRLATNPNDAEALSWLSAIADASGDLEGAVDYARRAAQAAPDSSEVHCQYADVLGDKAVKAGVFGGGLPLARQMRRELDLSLKLDPRNVRCLRESMGLYQEAPALIGGSKSKARQTLQQIYAIDPSQGARAEAGLLQMEKRPLSEIEASLRRAVQLNPHFYAALIDLVTVLESDSYRRYAEAEHFARQALAADPAAAAAYVHLAADCARQQHWSDLDAALAEAHGHVPGDSTPLYSAAIALLESGAELPRAERYLRQYLSQPPEPGAPTLSTAHWKLGLVLEKEGRRADAARELRAAAPGSSDNPAFKKDYKRIVG